MNFWNFLNRKSVTPLVLLVVAVAAAAAAGLTTQKLAEKPPPTTTGAALSPRELYDRSVVNAMVIKPEDIKPLVAIAESAPLCTWKDGKVLMLTWHRYPESYIPGENNTLRYGEVWTFTDKEILDRYRKEKERGTTDWDLRFRQLIGVPPDKEYTHFTAMWTDPKDLVRPGYAWKLADTLGASAFVEKPDDEFKGWFDGNIIRSYFDSAYPWTRLGYTYDWAGDGKQYGLSEFLIKKGSAVEVEFTLTTGEFIEWLEKQAK